MRLVFAVFCLLIVYVTCYPAFDENATDNDENNFELELRSILNQLDEEKMTRSLAEDNDDDDDEYTFSKRQGGHNVIDNQSACEIKCNYNERNPPSGGKGKSVKEAAAICKKKCPVQKKKRVNTKDKDKDLQKKAQTNKKLSLRQFIDDDDDSNNSEDEQQAQRREFYNYLMEQLE